MVELTAKPSRKSLPSWPTPMRGGNEFLSVEGLIISLGEKTKKKNKFLLVGEEDDINSEKD